MENIYGLIGKSLGHSFSKNYFSKKFLEEGIRNSSYINLEIEVLSQEIPVLKGNAAIRGLNITIPYKSAILQYVDDFTEAVSAMEAANCIQIVNGKWTAHNTDVIGFERSFEPLLKPFHNRALVLGTGGASAAVQDVLRKMEIPFVLVSRSKEDTLPYEAVDAEIVALHPIIINTTPLGMFPHVMDSPKLPYEAITSRHYLYDLIYNPPITQFLQAGRKAGAVVKNGAEMLEIQAEESWRIWNS